MGTKKGTEVDSRYEDLEGLGSFWKQADGG